MYKKDEKGEPIKILNENNEVSGYEIYFTEEDLNYNRFIADGWEETIKEEFEFVTLVPVLRANKIQEMRIFYNRKRNFFIENNGIKLYLCCCDVNMKENNIEYFGLQALQGNIQDAEFRNIANVQYRGTQLSVDSAKILYNAMNSYWVFIGKVKTYFENIPLHTVAEVENFDYNYNPFITATKTVVDSFQEKVNQLDLILQ